MYSSGHFGPYPPTILVLIEFDPIIALIPVLIPGALGVFRSTLIITFTSLRSLEVTVPGHGQICACRDTLLFYTDSFRFGCALVHW